VVDVGGENEGIENVTEPNMGDTLVFNFLRVPIFSDHSTNPHSNQIWYLEQLIRRQIGTETYWNLLGIFMFFFRAKRVNRALCGDGWNEKSMVFSHPFSHKPVVRMQLVFLSSLVLTLCSSSSWSSQAQAQTALPMVPPYLPFGFSLNVSGTVFFLEPLNFDVGAPRTGDYAGMWWINLVQPIQSPAQDQCSPNNTFVCCQIYSYQGNNNTRYFSHGSRPRPTMAVKTAAGFDLSYADGASCNGYPAQSLFHMSCGQSLGSPSFYTESANPVCIYEFNWKTEAACPFVQGDEFFIRGPNSTVVNLLPLATQVWSTPNSEFPNNIENIALCGVSTSAVNANCPANAAVCETTTSTGTAVGYGKNPALISTDANGNVTTMTFTSMTGSCYNSTIRFVCDPSADDTVGPVHCTTRPITAARRLIGTPTMRASRQLASRTSSATRTISRYSRARRGQCHWTMTTAQRPISPCATRTWSLFRAVSCLRRASKQRQSVRCRLVHPRSPTRSCRTISARRIQSHLTASRA